MVAIKVLFVFAQTSLLLHLCVCVNEWEPEERTSDTANWLNVHQSMLKQTADHKSDIKVVFLGDSITAHWLTEGKDLWTKAYVPLGAYNYGIGGDTTQNIIWRIQNKELDGLNPKVVVLMIGTNNIVTNATEANIAKGIKEIITEVEKKLTSTKVLLLGVTPRNTGAYTTFVKNLNALIAKYDDQKTTFYLDMSSHFLDSSQSEITSLFVDGKHFTAAGYQVWHDTMNTLFTKLNA